MMCIKRLERCGSSFLWVVLLLFYFSGTASAADQPKIALSTTAEKEVKVEKNGNLIVERIPLEIASPGDTVIYTITYRNEGETAARDILINDPIPRGTVYVLNSTEGKDAEITFRLDGGR